MNKLSLFHLFSAFTLLAACSDPSVSDPVSVPAPEITEPTVTGVEVTLELHAKPDGAFGQLAAASAGDGGAIAFAESDGWDGVTYAQTWIKLQRLDSTGAALGAPTLLSVIPSNNGADDVSRLTLASDGTKYLACWAGSNTKISCASTPVDQGDASPALSLSGRWPSLAYGADGWALGYAAADHLAVLHLDDAGMGVGNPLLLEGTADTEPQVFLAATPTGFALLGETGGTMHLHFLNNTLSQLAAPIDLGQMYWFHGALAASGPNVAVSLGYPYEGRLFLLDKTITKSQSFFAEAGKTGLNATLGVDGSSFGMLSADTGSVLHYGALNEEGTSPPSAGTLDVEKGAYSNGSLAVVKLHNETFLAAAPNAWSQGGKLVVAWAHRM